MCETITLDAKTIIIKTDNEKEVVFQKVCCCKY